MAAVTTPRQAGQLPAGTVIGIPTALGVQTTAVREPRGWRINGADFLVSNSQLFAYGRGWVTREPVDGECSACGEPHGAAPCEGWE